MNCGTPVSVCKERNVHKCTTGISKRVPTADCVHRDRYHSMCSLGTARCFYPTEMQVYCCEIIHGIRTVANMSTRLVYRIADVSRSLDSTAVRYTNLNGIVCQKGFLRFWQIQTTIWKNMHFFVCVIKMPSPECQIRLTMRLLPLYWIHRGVILYDWKCPLRIKYASWFFLRPYSRKWICSRTLKFCG